MVTKKDMKMKYINMKAWSAALMFVGVSWAAQATSYNGEKEIRPRTTYTLQAQQSATRPLPQYPGGNKALMEFMRQNIKYPDQAKEKGLYGQVIVKFDVNIDGTITSAKVAHSVDPILDNEALRVISLMPKWLPALDESGNPKKASFSLPFIFHKPAAIFYKDK